MSADRELYEKLAEEAGNTASLTAYVKRALGEHLSLNIKIADRQEFHRQMLSVVREEMQAQGMKLVGVLLARLGTVGVPVSQKEKQSREPGTELPEACGELPEELQGILDFIR